MMMMMMMMIRRIAISRRLTKVCSPPFASLTTSSSITTSYSSQRWMSSSTANTTNNNEVRVAIVGSGPSGCYTAKYLLLHSKSSTTATTNFKIDVLDRLPTPFGLVRSGVAPDHPEVKNVQNDFTTLFEEEHNQNSISFYGNVTLGRDIMLHELRQLYDVVVLAYGCESNRTLDHVSGMSLKGVVSAREFVAWYNGHPDYMHIGAVVQDALEHSDTTTTDVVVIGHGNVALDCARIVAKGQSGLLDTDIVAHALPVLKDGVTNTTIVGRRGHIQGAFTIKEVRELVKLQQEGHDASFRVLPEELELGMTQASLEELNGPKGRPKKRIDKLLHEAAAAAAVTSGDSAAAASKQVSLRFLLNPVRMEEHEKDPSRLGAVVCEHTRLQGEAGAQSASGTGRFESFPAQLALVSVGYKGVPVPGVEKYFDQSKGVVMNAHGKVAEASENDGCALYVSGWLKRGPSGIIGTNIADAKDTVASIVKDLEDTPSIAETSQERTLLSDVLQERNVQVVDWQAYQRINDFETTHTRTPQQPREKIPTLERLLKAANER